MTTERLKPLIEATFTKEQQGAAQKFQERRGRLPFGPYAPLLLSPEFMLDVEALGRRVRYGSCLPFHLKEMATLLTARHFGQVYEWSVHQPIAVEKGLSADICKAIGEGKRPPNMNDDETLIYDGVSELLLHHTWSDARFEQIKARFSERALVEIPTLIGLYSTLAYVLNIARTPQQEGALPLSSAKY